VRLPNNNAISYLVMPRRIVRRLLPILSLVMLKVPNAQFQDGKREKDPQLLFMDVRLTCAVVLPLSHQLQRKQFIQKSQLASLVPP